MTSAAKSLVRAILTRLHEVNSTANKTKLLKLHYLADIEHFRKADRLMWQISNRRDKLLTRKS